MTAINNDDQRERYKDDFAKCPPQISSATRQALENEGFDEANASRKHLENLLDEPNCPLVVPLKKLKKCSHVLWGYDQSLLSDPAGIRGAIDDYYNGLSPDDTMNETLEKLLNNWPDDHPEEEDLEIAC